MCSVRFCRVNAEGAAASRPRQDRRREACRPGQDAQFASSLSPPWNKGGGAVPRAQPSSSAWRSSQRRSCEAERAQQLAAQGKTARQASWSLPPRARRAVCLLPFSALEQRGGRSASCPAKFKCLAKLPKKKLRGGEGAAASRPGQDRRREACRPGQDAQFASSLSPPWNKGGAQCLVPSQVQVPGEAPKEEEEDEEKEGPWIRECSGLHSITATFFQLPNHGCVIMLRVVNSLRTTCTIWILYLPSTKVSITNPSTNGNPILPEEV